MIEQKWTKEPWNCDGVFLWVEGMETATGTHPDGTPYPFPVQVQQQVAQFGTPEDAQRAYACVNALAGIDDPSAFVSRVRVMEEALKKIAATAGMSKYRPNELERCCFPDRSVDSDGYADMPTDMKRGLEYNAKIAKSAPTTPASEGGEDDTLTA